MRKHKAKALEFAWDSPEAFRLEIATTIDGQHLQRIAERKERARQESEASQLDLLAGVHKSSPTSQGENRTEKDPFTNQMLNSRLA